MDCLFCKIIHGEIPSIKVYEDEDTYALLDIKPVNPGHTLVLPKKHVSTLLDANPETLNKLIVTAQKIARAMMPALGFDGFNLGQNNGAVAGQSVSHLHFHLMPRRKDDGYHLWTGQPYASPEEANAVAEKIRQALTR